MPHVQWETLSPGGQRLEAIRFEMGFLDRKEFARILSIHPSDYCRILRNNERLTIHRLVSIFKRLIDRGYYKYKPFEAVRSDFDLFDDGCLATHVYFTLRRIGAIAALQKAYEQSMNRSTPID